MDADSEAPGGADGTSGEVAAPSLLEDVGTAGLKAKVAAAWQDFARALATVVAALPASAELILTLDPTASGTGDAVYDVVVSARTDGSVAANAVGNAELPPGYRLDRAAIADLIALGWSPPGVVDGSGPRFGMLAPAGETTPVAAAVTRTLRDVYGAPHPAFLTYTASDGVEVPSLGAARHAVDALAAPDDYSDEELGDEEHVAPHRSRSAAVDPSLPLSERVRLVVAALLRSEPDSLTVDDDGDISIRSGSAMVFVRLHENPALVDVYSPILTGITPNERLYHRLSQLTRRMPIGRLYCVDDTVWASVVVFGRDFQPTHLVLAVQVMTRLADELDDRLQGDFGGRRFFGEGDKTDSDRAEGDKTDGDGGDQNGGSTERTGMYL